MCGRFAIFSRPEDYLDQLSLDEAIRPCEAVEYYNAYPTQALPAVYRDPKVGLRCELLHWGLIPSWAKDIKIGYKTANARWETAAEKPSFRHAIKQQRAIVPVDGWFEWLREGKQKQPYYHHRPDGQVIWLAGLWEHWINPETSEPLRSFTLLTQDAQGKVAKIHNRMPVCMKPENVPLWLDNQLQARDKIEAIIQDIPKPNYDIYPVTPAMNSPKHQGEDSVLPASKPLD